MSTIHGEESARSAEGAPLRIVDILMYLRGNLLLTLGVPLACLLLAVASVALIAPVYRSEVVLLPITDDAIGGSLGGIGGQLGGLASMAGISLPGAGSSAAALATLGSKRLIEAFIEREGLLPVLFAEDFDTRSGKWTTDNPPTLDDAVDLFDRKIRTVFDEKDTGLVTLSIDWHDPALAARWAGQLVELADDEMRRAAIQEAESSLAFLRKQLGETDLVELREAIFSLMESETKRIMLASSRPDYAFRIIDPPRVARKDDPVWPSVPLILVGALLVGLAIVFVVAVVRTPERK